MDADGSSSKRVAITGASAGLGAAMVRAFVGAGWAVSGLSRRGLVPDVPGVHGVAADATDPKTLAAALQPLTQAPGGLDALICNAGVM